jgi:hypothetical protein
MPVRNSAFYFIVLLIFFSLSTLPAFAEDNDSDTQKPCTQPEAAQFDFWVGKWNATWGDSAQGTNNITKILDGCVILEQFDGTPGTPLKGMSVSTYNPRMGQWQQTWVDNSGSYLDFVGGMEGNKMILSRRFTKEGKPIAQRMVFENITDNSFDWRWERSTGNDSPWEVLWKIHYTRK